MEICIFDIIKIMDTDKVRGIMKDTNVKRFSHKGDNIVLVNNRIVDEAVSHINKIDVDSEWINLNFEEENDKTFDEMIGLLKGNELPVSAFIDRKSGIYPGGSTKFEKRDIAENVSCWNK